VANKIRWGLQGSNLKNPKEAEDPQPVNGVRIRKKGSSKRGIDSGGPCEVLRSAKKHERDRGDRPSPRYPGKHVGQLRATGGGAGTFEPPKTSRMLRSQSVGGFRRRNKRVMKPPRQPKR